MSATKTAPTADPPKAPREFSFAASLTVPVPEVPVRQAANKLPFEELFSRDLPTALEGKQPHVFVPDEYWRSRNPESKIDKSFGRTKVRDQFNKWQKNEKASNKGDREKVELSVVYRNGNEPGFTEPGISYWLLLKK